VRKTGRQADQDLRPANDDIATLTNDIASGNFVVDGKRRKKSVSNARHMRRACTAMFKWAAQAGNKYVTKSPCHDLPPLTKEPSRRRVLSEDEIRTLWHGLDRNDLPFDRRIRLAIKFALVSMLRSNEMLPIHRSELDLKHNIEIVPAERVKKRRPVYQPLSDLALEIIKESLGNYDYAFSGRFGDAPLSRQAMSNALKGDKKAPGICTMLGMKPFVPHDLRRTAATHCGFLCVPDADIGLCLDHQPNTDENGNEVQKVTNEVYNLAAALSPKTARKRRALDAWAVKLREIISEPATELRLAA
jgi:integrase